MKYCCSEMKQMDSNGHIDIIGNSYLVAIKSPVIIAGEPEFEVYELEYCFHCGGELK